MSAAGGRAPGPRGRKVWAVLRARGRDPFRTMVDLAREYGGIVDVRIAGTSHFLVSDAAAIRHVLVENAESYGKAPGYALWGRILGRGLVTSDGEHWRAHRRVIQPSLHRDHMADFVSVMADVVETAVDDLEAEAGGIVDLYDFATRVALRIAARAFLGTDLRDDEDELCRSLIVVFDHIQGLSASPLRALGVIPGLRRLHPWLEAVRRRTSPAERRFEEALATLDRIIGEVVARRRRAVARDGARGGARGDLVSRLLVTSEADVAFSDVDVRDEVMTMFVAGHETTAAGMAWCLRLVAEHPEIQDRLAGEADAVLGPGSVALADLDGLSLARRVFQESLRLYPPVWRVSRQALAPDSLGGYPVAPGSTVILSPWLLHHDPSFWPDPERFDPARFLDESWPREAYLPFGAGRRMCPGGHFAAAEAQVILATLTRRLVLRPPTPEPPAFEPRLTLRPRGGMPLRILRRAAAPSTS